MVQISKKQKQENTLQISTFPLALHPKQLVKAEEFGFDHI